MTVTRPTLTHAPALLLLLAGCSASHEIEAVGAAGEPLCVAYFLGFDYGSSVWVHRNTDGGPVDPTRIELSDPMRGDRRFSAVTTLDVDGDGLRDVVIRDAYGGAALLEERVSLALFRGAPASFEARELERFVGSAEVSAGGGIDALGDWNGDGLSDLSAQYDASIILGGETLREVEGICRRGVNVGDVDGDGTDDTACETEDAGIRVHLGGSASPAIVEIPFDSPIGFLLAAGDSNGDGRPELLAELRGTWTMLDLAAGTGAEISDAIRSVRPVGDVDGDGLADFVARRADEFHLWRGSPSGPVEDDAPFSVVGDGERSVTAAGDASCDGYADVLVRDHLPGGPDRVALHLGGPEGVSPTPTWRADVTTSSFVPIYD